MKSMMINTVTLNASDEHGYENHAENHDEHFNLFSLESSVSLDTTSLAVTYYLNFIHN